MNLIGALIISVVFVTSVILALVFAGVFKVSAQEITVSSGSATAVYDGKALTNGEYSLVSGKLEQGHKIMPTITGKQIQVGKSENHITAKVVDAEGKDVSKRYHITYKPGTLTVLSRPIKLVADSELKLYDGTPLTSYKFHLSPTSLELAPGHTFGEVVLDGSITEVGEAVNRITSVLIRNKKNEDVTRNYSITTQTGKLIVYDENTLVFASGSNFKVYDGTPLTYDYWEMLSGALMLSMEHEKNSAAAFCV